jgi:rhodanese-related sulfurtransferase
MRNKGFRIAMFLGVIASASCSHYDTFPGERSSGLDEPAALEALIAAGQTVGAGDFRIVDVRPEGAYKKGHIPTATNLPNGNLEEGNALPPMDKLIIVYCETGGRAEMAARKMGQEGYAHIYNWGGFGKWSYPAEK